MKFYHIKNLQSTKTSQGAAWCLIKFYHIKNLQSTKTIFNAFSKTFVFYHIKNLQSTKTEDLESLGGKGFITLRIYKVLKQYRE